MQDLREGREQQVMSCVDQIASCGGAGQRAGNMHRDLMSKFRKSMVVKPYGRLLPFRKKGKKVHTTFYFALPHEV